MKTCNATDHVWLATEVDWFAVVLINVL